MHNFNISYQQLSLVYIGLSIGSCASVLLTKYIYNVSNLKLVYLVLISVLIVDFSWAFFTKSWQVFCFLRLIQGICLTLLYSLSFVDTMVNSTNKISSMNFINGVSIFGLIAGPALSGYLSLIKWQYIFLLFNLILIISIFFLRKIEFTKKEFKLISLSDFIEYIVVASIIILVSLIFEGSINSSYLVVILMLSITLFFKYKRSSNYFIFRKEILNSNLFNSALINLFCRFSLSGLIPILASILYKNYQYTTLQISWGLTIMGISSLISKVIHKKLPTSIKFEKKLFYLYIFSLIIMILLPLKFAALVFTSLFIFGVSSSFIYNLVNGSMFISQDFKFTDDLSVMLTLIQMLFYGICTTITFNIFSDLKDFFNFKISFIIVLLLMSVSVYIAMILYNMIKKETLNCKN